MRVPPSLPAPHALPKSVLAGCLFWLELAERCLRAGRDPTVLRSVLGFHVVDFPCRTLWRRVCAKMAPYANSGRRGIKSRANTTCVCFMG